MATTALNLAVPTLPDFASPPASGLEQIRQPQGSVHIPVEELNRKHPQYGECEPTWSSIDLLYEGGDKLCKMASRVLRQRPRELKEIYQSRMESFTYQNVLGSGVDYYLAAIFLAEPEIDAKMIAKTGERVEVQLRPQQRLFYDRFKLNCDRKGTTLTDFFRETLKNLILYRYSWILIDLPRPNVRPATLAEQQQGGWLDPYLVSYSPRDVLNWAVDESGNLQWAVVYGKQLQQTFRGKPLLTERWYYFDQENFELWESVADQSQGQKKNPMATLVASGPHALSEFQIVPVSMVEVPPGMWLANRILPQVRAHLNQDNTYGWALQQSNLCMPVLIGNIKEIPTLSEAGFIKLPEGSSISWTEPPGNSFERSEARLIQLVQEIYRQMYLSSQGRDQGASPLMQSGYSKSLDMTPAGHIQNFFGDKIRAATQTMLNLASKIRGDQGLEWDVRGYQFVEEPIELEMQRGMTFSQMQVPSELARKENLKKVCRARFPDMNPTTIKSICDEVDQSPSPEEIAQAQAEAQQENYAQQMQQQSAIAVQGAEAKEMAKVKAQEAVKPQKSAAKS